MDEVAELFELELTDELELNDELDATDDELRTELVNEEFLEDEKIDVPELFELEFILDNERLELDTLDELLEGKVIDEEIAELELTLVVLCELNTEDTMEMVEIEFNELVLFCWLGWVELPEPPQADSVNIAGNIKLKMN